MHAVALFYSVLLGEVRMRIANRQQGVQRSCSTPDFVGLGLLRGFDQFFLFQLGDIGVKQHRWRT